MDSHLCTPPDGRAAGDLWRCTCGAVWRLDVGGGRRLDPEGCSPPVCDVKATAETAVEAPCGNRAAGMSDLMEDRERLETIVRALAVFDPGVEIPTSSTRNETATLCITCDTVLAGDAWDEEQSTFGVGPHPHKPDCPWALARQWVEANPAQRIDLHGE